MAEAPETSKTLDFNRQLTRSLSNILYEDQLSVLMKKYEAIEDKSDLLPEIEKAMQACLTIQELLQGEQAPGVSDAGQFPSKKTTDLNEHPVKVATTENGYPGGVEIDMGSEHEVFLQEVNPSMSASWNTDTFSQELADNGPSSLGFESSLSPALEKCESPADDYVETDTFNDLPSGKSKKWSVTSLEIANPSSDFKSSGSDNSSAFTSGRSKKWSVTSLEVANPSLDYKSSGLQSSGSPPIHPDCSNECCASMEVDNESLLIANPSLDEPFDHGNDMTVLIFGSKFNVTLKPSTLKADIFSKVDVFCCSSINCVHFNNNDCQYTIPVDGNYEFGVRKLGRQNVQCCLRKNGENDSKACQATSKWRRGNTKLVVNWKCSAGQTVWVEGKGQTKDCGIAIVFSGSLLKNDT